MYFLFIYFSIPFPILNLPYCITNTMFFPLHGTPLSSFLHLTTPSQYIQYIYQIDRRQVSSIVLYIILCYQHTVKDQFVYFNSSVPYIKQACTDWTINLQLCKPRTSTQGRRWRFFKKFNAKMPHPFCPIFFCTPLRSFTGST